jgi:hypothetical protein
MSPLAFEYDYKRLLEVTRPDEGCCGGFASWPGDYGCGAFAG